GVAPDQPDDEREHEQHDDDAVGHLPPVVRRAVGRLLARIPVGLPVAPPVHPGRALPLLLRGRRVALGQDLTAPAEEERRQRQRDQRPHLIPHFGYFLWQKSPLL